MDLVRVLRWWQEILIPVDKSFGKRLQSTLLGTKPLSYFLLWALVSVTLSALRKGSALKAFVALRMSSSMVGCYGCVLFFAVNRKQLYQLIGESADLAESICALGYSREIEEKASWAYRFTLKGYRVSVTWSAVASVSILIPVALNGKLLMGMWPWFSGPFGVYLGGFLQAVFAYPGCMPLYVSCLLTWSITLTFSYLFHVLGDRIEAAETRKEVLEFARLHTTLCGLAHRLRMQLDFLLTCVLICVVTTPALSTVTVVRGRPDMYCAPSVPQLLVFYVWSKVGQILEELSTNIVIKTYSGYSNKMRPVMDRALLTDGSDRTRHIIMMKATKPERIGAFKGSVTLNLDTFGTICRSWYNMLQILLKMPDETDPNSD